MLPNFESDEHPQDPKVSTSSSWMGCTGGFSEWLIDWFVGIFSRRRIKVCMYGVLSCGKTSLLYKMAKCDDGENHFIIPTVGYHVKTVHHGNLEMSCYDIGGGSQAPPNWYQFFKDCDAIMYLIDSQNIDVDDLDFSLRQLEINILQSSHLPPGIPLLILLTKFDFETDTSVPQFRPEDIIRECKLLSTLRRPWTVRTINALEGEGFDQALNWISDNIKSPTVTPEDTPKNNQFITDTNV